MLAASLFCFQLAAYSQVRVGIAGGVSLANMEGNISGNSKAGAFAGLVMDAPIAKSFSFHPTLSYVQKGVSEEKPTLLLAKRNTALRYVEFTTDFHYNIPGAHGAFYIGAGPSIAFDLPSKRVEIANDENVPKNTTIIHFGRESINDLKGFDYGANFAAGYRLAGGFFVNVNYNMGLRNLVVDGQSGSLKNKYFGIQLGYFLENGDPKK